MKKGLFLLLLLIPAALGAQSIGQVHYGSRVFSTGLPEYLDGYWDPEVREPVCMDEYTIVSPRFLVGDDWIVGGLRVGRKPNMKSREGVHVEQDKKDSSRYNYYLEDSDVFLYFILDEDGRIKEIVAWFNGC